MRMKQIIIVTNERDKLENETVGRGLYITWCPFDIKEIQRVRDQSNVIFLCVKNEDPNELKRISLYLRDLCIEEEKLLYLYGNQQDVDDMRRRLPVLYIRKIVYSHSAPFSALLDDLNDLIRETEPYGPTILFLDDNTEYIAKLRPYLEPHFTIYVNHYEMQDAFLMILRSNIVVVSMDKSLSLLQFMELFRPIYTKKKSPGFHLYYLTTTAEERDRVNTGSDRFGISFSRDMDVARVANFFIRSFVPDAEVFGEAADI